MPIFIGRGVGALTKTLAALAGVTLIRDTCSRCSGTILLSESCEL